MITIVLENLILYVKKYKSVACTIHCLIVLAH